MKKLAFTCLIFFLFSCTPEKKNTLTKEKLNGAVSELTITEYDAEEKFGEAVPIQLTSKKVAKFNKNGNIIESTSFNSVSKLISKHTVKYDEKGNPSQAYDSVSTIEIVSYKYKEFDKNNNWTKMVKLSNGSPYQMIEREIKYY